VSAAIEIGPDAFVVGIWHFELPERLSEFGKGGNYLGILWRHEHEPSTWHLRYRFRHYRDLETVWESNDTFHCYELIARGDEETVRSQIDAVIQYAARVAGGALVDYTQVRGGAQLAHERMLNLPWFHGRMAAEQEHDHEQGHEAV
jgi:hypothetical protein